MAPTTSYPRGALTLTLVMVAAVLPMLSAAWAVQNPSNPMPPLP